MKLQSSLECSHLQQHQQRLGKGEQQKVETKHDSNPVLALLHDWTPHGPGLSEARSSPWLNGPL